jgi:hypothetical protein
MLMTQYRPTLMTHQYSDDERTSECEDRSTTGRRRDPSGWPDGPQAAAGVQAEVQATHAKPAFTATGRAAHAL